MIKAKQSKATSKPLTVARQIDRQTTKTKIYSFYNLIASKDVIFYKIEFYRFFSKRYLQALYVHILQTKIYHENKYYIAGFHSFSIK